MVSSMNCPVQVTSRDFDLSESINRVIAEQAHKLCRFNDRLVGLRLVIGAPRYHQRHGLVYSLTLELNVPGGELVVRRELYGDLHLAIRSAFDTAQRLLKDHTRRLRGAVKRHGPAPKVRVGEQRLQPEPRAEWPESWG